MEAHQSVLAVAGRLYERVRAGRPKRQFNVFEVLRSATDEVNLHSRFLHALLDHVDPGSGRRDNLEEFLGQVAGAADFEVDDARVEREVYGIDLLVSNGRQAVVVENKIWAGDQHRQLERYRDALVDLGYEDSAVRLLYLTPHGHQPAAQSRGRIPPGRIGLVSHRDDLPPWLTGCQRRAFAEPGLREAVGQYIQLIRKMTNSDHEGETMDELRAHLLRDENLVVAGRIARALAAAEATVVRCFYLEVDRVLRGTIEHLPEVDPEWVHLAEEAEIRRCIGRARGSDSGLYYPIRDRVWLCVGGANRLWFGVYCEAGEYAELHKGLKAALAGVGGSH